MDNLIELFTRDLMYWLALIIAGVFEIVWAVGLKYTHGFTKLFPSLITGGAMAMSMLLLTYSLRGIPLGTSYAVWTGIGASGTLILGIFLFNESKDPIRIACILLIIIAIVVLKFTHK